MIIKKKKNKKAIQHLFYGVSGKKAKKKAKKKPEKEIELAHGDEIPVSLKEKKLYISQILEDLNEVCGIILEDEENYPEEDEDCKLPPIPLILLGMLRITEIEKSLGKSKVWLGTENAIIAVAAKLKKDKEEQYSAFR